MQILITKTERKASVAKNLKRWKIRLSDVKVLMCLHNHLRQARMCLMEGFNEQTDCNVQ